MIREILNNEVKKYGDFKVWWNGDDRGDYSTNVGNPEVAEKIKSELTDSKYISKIEIEKGFVNFFLSDETLEEILTIICGRNKLSNEDREEADEVKRNQNIQKKQKNQKIQVEFISANPTGPLTVGNSRGGIIGDVLSSVLAEAGHQVTREYYFNDAGGQIDSLGHSVLKDDKAEYRGEYIDKLHKELKNGDYREVGKKAAKILIEQIKETTRKAGIEYDVWFAEGRDLRNKGKVDEIIKWLKQKDLAYEKEGALWFKATEFGDDKDRVLIKSSGEPTYFAVDCAYHNNKFVEREFDKVINIWGADHHGDVPRVKGFVKALGFEDKFEIILHQFVRIVKDGKEVRMSKRAGNYVTLADLLTEVGRDVYRYFMLQHSANTHMDFDLGLAKEQSKKNPVYYVQYAGARMSSILANEKRKTKNEKRQLKIQNLKEKQERRLILKLIQFPEIIQDTAEDYQVQRLTTYIYELAKTFTGFYENVKVIGAESEELKEARLNLVAITRQMLERVLSLMKISAPEKM
ncbi:arginine--tRNA ligase [Patescibacteria group bacterium]